MLKKELVNSYEKLRDYVCESIKSQDICLTDGDMVDKIINSIFGYFEMWIYEEDKPEVHISGLGDLVDTLINEEVVGCSEYKTHFNFYHPYTDHDESSILDCKYNPMEPVSMSYRIDLKIDDPEVDCSYVHKKVTVYCTVNYHDGRENITNDNLHEVLKDIVKDIRSGKLKNPGWITDSTMLKEYE